MISIGVKSKYGSCNGNCTGCIIIIDIILLCYVERKKNL
jgi:hypothetical protein